MTAPRTPRPTTVWVKDAPLMFDADCGGRTTTAAPPVVVRQLRPTVEQCEACAMPVRPSAFDLHAREVFGSRLLCATCSQGGSVPWLDRIPVWAAWLVIAVGVGSFWAVVVWWLLAVFS